MPAPTLPSENPGGRNGTPSGYALEFDNVSIAFDEKVVLDGISFQLPHGETKALFGVAGSGKSTLLKLAMGLLRPDSGRIFVLGEEVTQHVGTGTVPVAPARGHRVPGKRAFRLAQSIRKRRLSA